jgi:cytochrome c556
MRAKLAHSQKLLEGLTTANFDLLAKHSQELALLSQATNWNVLQTEDYLQHSIEFRRAANAVTEAAKQKNLDGATLAFVDMTMKCVRCHKYVRGVSMAGTDAGDRFDALSLNRAGGER